MGDWSQARGWGRLAVVLALSAALSATVAACGADDEPADGGGDRSATPSRTQTSATTDTEATDKTDTKASDPTDGRLTNTSGEVTTDYGDRSDRVAAVRVLDQLQQEFQAGQMAAACTKISDFLLSQFTPPGTKDLTSCPKKLEAYAAQRAQRGDQPERLELLWVRSYTYEAGIWADDSKGRRIRIQITKNPGDGWQFDLGALGRPDILAAELVGADEYVKGSDGSSD